MSEFALPPFGGSTSEKALGSFVHDDGRITREEITKVSSACAHSTLSDEQARARILNFAKELSSKLGQESVLVGWGDRAFVVSEAFELDSVAILRFAELSPEAQSKHLTMGWGGIDRPEKILQVLSLDGWTLPQGDALDVSGPLSLRAVLQEEGGARRAWSWPGALSELKAALGEKITRGLAREGDLIFLRSEDDYLDMVMLQGGGVKGPRNLRLSHGQLNPVTRDLLRRVLMREWDGLAQDLAQKPLDQRFFPQLQKLRDAIEKAVLAIGNELPTEASRTRVRKLNVTPAERERAPFRTSVLVVGRMMFLRFLAQKGWLPGGVDGLVEAQRRHGDHFFAEHVLPLWFDVLNTPVAERTPTVRAQFSDEYPYLNGGLFQPRPGERELSLPGAIFDPEVPGSFLKLFLDFEFSLNEHAGSDDSLRVDPSFFGKALESFNSNDEKKSQGVHYTPKPIAWALALDAIVARVSYLSDIERSRIENLLRGTRGLTGQDASKVQRVLEELRIIDPAVGSGVLLWACLEVLLTLDSACEGVIGGGDGYQRGSHKWGQRSRHFVCNCLYGVDLSEEAVELTRLRLWLAVALSEDAPQLLPDLELNICRGDSLLEAPPSPVGSPTAAPVPAVVQPRPRQMRLPLDAATRLMNDLAQLTQDYNGAGEKNPTLQRAIRGKIFAARRKLASFEASGTTEDMALNWDVFFPHVFRKDGKGGFDVVIANPPYVRVQKSDPTLLAGYRSAWSTLRDGNADLSFAFVELALRKLAAPDGGQIAFIQPNFRHHDAATPLRRMLVGLDPTVSVKMRLWVDFDATQVFPTATNYVALIFGERYLLPPPPEPFMYSCPDGKAWERGDTAEDATWLRPQGRTHSHPAQDEWLTLPAELRSRVLHTRSTARGTLDDIADIRVGVQTSGDDVFLFEGAVDMSNTIAEVFSKETSCPVRLERDVLRRCVKGSKGSDYYLLFPYTADGSLLPEDELRRRFPLAWSYLAQNETSLRQREKGKFDGPNWHRFGRDQGFSSCSLRKVLVPSMLKGANAIVDEDGVLAFTASGKGGGGAWAIVPKAGADLAEIAAALQSDSAWDHILAFGSPQRDGWRGVDRGVLRGIPI